MNTYTSLGCVKEAFNLSKWCIEVTDTDAINLCENEDDPVIIQIGLVDDDGRLGIDTELATQAPQFYALMDQYFLGGFHGGITMLVLSIKPDGYLLCGDDIDNESATIEIRCETLEEMTAKINALL
jgi:hypothetical protein